MTTSLPSSRLRSGRRPDPAPVAWSTVAVLAVLMAYADGFVLTSIQGAVGAIERAQGPFAFWLRTSTLMLPLFALAVVGALVFARRRFGPSLRAPGRVVAAALVIVVAGGVVGTGELVVSTAYDYHLQSELLLTTESTHAHVVPDAQPTAPGACTGVCAAQQLQLAVDQRAARLGSALVLGVNLVLVGWVVACRGGRLETDGPARRPRRSCVAAPAPES
jgi:hypothetical protein